MINKTVARVAMFNMLSDYRDKILGVITLILGIAWASFLMVGLYSENEWLVYFCVAILAITFAAYWIRRFWICFKKYYNKYLYTRNHL